MPIIKDERRELTFPIYALCICDASRRDQYFLAQGEIEGLESVIFYHNKELAELAVEQATKQTDQEHELLVIADKDHLIEVLKIIPHEVRHIVWNKQLEATGVFDLQIIDCLLGWQIRHK
jgi:hypothetical protein